MNTSEESPAPTAEPAPRTARPQSTVVRFAQPVGSPFGFTVADWEAVSLDHEDASRLIVVFGHPQESTYFDSERLRGTIAAELRHALTATLPRIGSDVALDFRVLEAGFGGHLFNQIACDIIASDIAVFETSDLNSNVMIEMGVALTWGTRVHPVRRHDAPRPPSDISGQTWETYESPATGKPQPTPSSSDTRRRAVFPRGEGEQDTT